MLLNYYRSCVIIYLYLFCHGTVLEFRTTDLKCRCGGIIVSPLYHDFYALNSNNCLYSYNIIKIMTCLPTIKFHILKVRYKNYYTLLYDSKTL